MDHLRGPDKPFGELSCGCHPNCGASVMLARSRRTKAWAPISAFFNIDQFMKDIDVIVDSARGRTLSLTQVGLSFLRNFDERKAPAGLTLARIIQLFRSRMGGPKAAGGRDPDGEWEFMWVASMWFQDLWTYDFRRTEMCVIPYGTQEGEISFCAYNTGVGWRQIVENMHMVATTRDWFKEKGRHTIYAGDRPIKLPESLKRRLPVVSVEHGNGNGNGNGHAHGQAVGQSGCGSGSGTGSGCGCH
jgi:uncharacterized radical SAM superfamily Fe-S cluster-containing enzyme